MKCRTCRKSTLMVLMGSAGAVVFLLPLLLQGLIVIGNLLGLLLSAALLLHGIFPGWFRRCRQSMREHWPGRALLALLEAGLAAGLLLAAALPWLMIPALSVRPDNQATAVILGCDVIGDQPGIMLQERLEAAYAWLDSHPAAAVVVTGGRASEANLSEADAMAEWLIQRGISSSRIYRDEEALSTSDNIRNAERIIRRNGLAPSLAIATSDYHVFRSLRIASHYGYKAGAIVGHTAWWLLPTYYAREIIGIVHEALIRQDL